MSNRPWSDETELATLVNGNRFLVLNSDQDDNLKITAENVRNFMEFNAALLAETNEQTFDGKITFTATAARAGINLGTQTSDPTTGNVNGDIYFNTVTKKFRGFDGTSWNDLSSITDAYDAVLEVAQDVNAFPDIVLLPTRGGKISGFVLPLSNSSVVNFKVIVPPSLAAIPNARIRYYFMTLTDTQGNAGLFVDTVFNSNNEDMDVSPTVETLVATSITNNSLFLYTETVSLTNTPSPGDFITGQIARDVSQGSAGDILLTKVQLLVDR